MPQRVRVVIRGKNDKSDRPDGVISPSTAVKSISDFLATASDNELRSVLIHTNSRTILYLWED